MAASAFGWVQGAAIGFGSAFFIQALAGHWKLWVDQRKSLVDDLIKALEAARSASVKYFEQENIPRGHHNEHAREVIYTQKVVTDLFGIIDRQFGPVSPIAGQSFRRYRELSTGEGFLQEGKQDRQRAADIVIVAATCSATLREWHCAELGPTTSVGTFAKRVWLRRPFARVEPFSATINRLTR